MNPISLTDRQPTLVIGGRAIATPLSLTVTGVRALAGSYAEISVTLNLTGWPAQDTPLVVIPCGLRAVMLAGGRSAEIGWCQAAPGSTLRPPPYGSTARLSFLLPLSFSAVEAIEDLRSGEDLEIESVVFARGYVGGTTVEAMHVWSQLKVPAKDWTRALAAAGFDDHVWVDVRVPVGEGPGGAAALLREAQEARSRGHHPEAVRKARIALEAIEKGGFGGHAPPDVIAFIKHKARQLTMPERLAALRAATELWLNPAHHPGGEVYTRRDATSALAIVSALIGLAEQQGPNPTQEG